VISKVGYRLRRHARPLLAMALISHPGRNLLPTTLPMEHHLSMPSVGYYRLLEDLHRV